MVQWLARSVLPVMTIIAAIVLIWYAAAVPMNAGRTYMMAPDDAEIALPELVSDTWAQKKPRLPVPHQIVVEVRKQATFSWIWKEKRRGYKRSLIYHTWVTLSSTIFGFVLGLVLGVSLSLAIVYSRVMDLSVMPWVITSQTIPIIAIAPMIIVIMAAGGMTGLMPKGVISMYLSYFPIVVAMTKGLRSSEPILEDQMKTWSATAIQTFWLLRLPSAMPFLFPAMKISLAAALVGAVVAELPSGARAGLGARLLVFSYRSETIPMWANLVSAALLAGILVVSFGLLERAVNRRLGFRNAGDVTS
jgi:NitT/TauT family transport system permease protein